MKRLVILLIVLCFVVGCVGLESKEPKISKDGFSYTDPFGPDFLAEPTRIPMSRMQLSWDLMLVFSYDPTHKVRSVCVVLKKAGNGLWGAQEYTYIYRGKLYMMIYKGDKKYEQKELTEEEIKEYYGIMVEVGKEHDQKFNKEKMNNSAQNEN